MPQDKESDKKELEVNIFKVWNSAGTGEVS